MMRRVSTWRVFLAMASASVCVSSSAESLTQAWQMGLSRNMEFAAVTAEVESARAAESAARGERWPSLTATASYTQFDNAPRLDLVAAGIALQAPIIAGQNYAAGGIQLKLPLYTGGRISAQIGAAQQAAAGAADSEAAARATLRLDIATAYVGVLRSQRLLQAAQSSVRSLTAHARDVKLLVERELVTRSDLLAAQVALANAEQLRVQADNGVALAYAAYNRLLGEPSERTPQLEATLPVQRALGEQPLNDLIRGALNARTELAALSARAEALSLQSDAQRAMSLPQLELSGGYNYFENEILDRQSFAAVGIGVSWNLFDGAVVRNRSEALRRASRAAQYRLDDLRAQVQLEVRQASLGVRAAQARIATLREARSQAEENLRMSRELYGGGLGTNTQVLDAVSLQIAATNNYDTAVLDEALALLTLERAVGQL
ncbi:MAG: TolC family protein [Pseudomonadota bacterium]|nr:TolC family protein [Pseudomonadota bacterium]